jgi:hypothetical protein
LGLMKSPDFPERGIPLRCQMARARYIYPRISPSIEDTPLRERNLGGFPYLGLDEKSQLS